MTTSYFSIPTGSWHYPSQLHFPPLCNIYISPSSSLFPHFKHHSPIFKPHEASGSLTTLSSFSLTFIPSLSVLDFMLRCFNCPPGGPFAFLLQYILPSGTYFLSSKVSNDSIHNQAAEHCCINSHHQAEWCYSRYGLQAQLDIPHPPTLSDYVSCFHAMLCIWHIYTSFNTYLLYVRCCTKY